MLPIVIQLPIGNCFGVFFQIACQLMVQALLGERTSTRQYHRASLSQSRQRSGTLPRRFTIAVIQNSQSGRSEIMATTAGALIHSAHSAERLQVEMYSTQESIYTKSHSYRNPITSSCHTHRTRFIFELRSIFAPSRELVHWSRCA